MESAAARLLGLCWLDRLRRAFGHRQGRTRVERGCLSSIAAAMARTTTFNLEQIVRGEPDAALFTVPGGYTRHDVSLPAARAAELTSSSAVITAVKKP